MESFNEFQRKKKVIFIIGATGTGKSKLAIELATCFQAEIVNSDKMQVHEGLDVVTNKVTQEEQCGITHHLLGVLNPNVDFTASDFGFLASEAIESITKRNRVPIIVGGSNTYIQVLVDDEMFQFRSKYEFCFIWLDVSLHVLHSFVSERVEKMVNDGLVKEVRNIFEPDADYSQGIRRSIGVPEMDQYLRLESIVDDETRKNLLKVAIDEIKENTIKLTCRQVEKIKQFKTRSDWNLHRIDATKIFLTEGKEQYELWKKFVVNPCTEVISKFLYDGFGLSHIGNSVDGTNN